MGSRVQRAVPKDLAKKKKKATDRQDSSERAAKRRQEASSFPLPLLGFPPTGFLVLLDLLNAVIYNRLTPLSHILILGVFHLRWQKKCS
jgi:hypothetical protein